MQLLKNRTDIEYIRKNVTTKRRPVEQEERFMSSMTANNVMISLEIMLKGMAGIFVTVLIIMVIVYVLGKIGKKGSKK